VVHKQIFRQEPTLDEVASVIQGVDLILTEGYKRGAAPKIVVVRGQSGLPPLSDPGTVVAVVSDQSTDLPVPHFDLDDTTSVASFIERRFLRPSLSAI